MAFPTDLDDAADVGGDSKPLASTALSDSASGHPDHATMHQNVGDAIIAVESKVGVGDSSAVANSVLAGTASGVSAWSGSPTLSSVTATTFTGALTGDVTGNVTGNVTGDVTGDLTGDVTGNVTGDVTGDVYASNGTSKVLDNGSDGTDAQLTGSVVGDVTGDLTGNVTSSGTSTFSGTVNLNGATVSNAAFDLTGDLTGNIVGDSTVTGQWTIDDDASTVNALSLRVLGDHGTSAVVDWAKATVVIDDAGSFPSLSWRSAYLDYAASIRLSTVASDKLVLRNSGDTGFGDLEVNALTESSDLGLKTKTGSALGLDFVNGLLPFAGHWNDKPGEVNFWLGAQEVADALAAAGVDVDSCGLVQNVEETMGLRYTQLVPVLVKAVQELSARLEAVEG